MAFDLTDEQRELRGRASSVGIELASRGSPNEGRVDRELLLELARSGLLGRLYPKGAVSAFDLCLLREGLAQGSTAAETALAMQGLGGYPILQSGRPETVERWVPRIARGEAVAAFALTEPEHGTDAAAIELKAERDTGGWRLSGVKAWISNAPEADVYTVFTRTTPDAKAKGVTAFVVPGDAEGVTGDRVELLSAHPIGTLRLERVFVPDGDVLGEVDGGFAVAMRTLDLFRPSVGAFAVGIAQRALDLSLAHAASREAFGKPLREFQAVSHAVAEMATRTDAARLMVYRAAAAYDEGQPGVTKTSAMAKLFATEAAQWVVDAAVQIHGASALERGHPLEHLYRDVRATRIYEGTSEIQREIIARQLFE